MMDDSDIHWRITMTEILWSLEYLVSNSTQSAADNQLVGLIIQLSVNTAGNLLVYNYGWLVLDGHESDDRDLSQPECGSWTPPLRGELL